jgi:anaerobic selenocysteine-containing dehydrogenase
METLQRTFCTVCSLGCGAVVRAAEGRLLAVEGDPEHPINRGALCAKGTLMLRAAASPNRLRRIRHRAPGAARWEEKTWDWALGRIAELLAATNRSSTERSRVAILGGTTVDGEDGAAILGLARAIGASHDCHARLSHASTYAALDATFGRPWPTFTPEDLQQCGAIVLWGANPADNHPIAMQWLLRAKDKGTALIVVDPRLTRSAAVADLHVPLCAGGDLVLAAAIVRRAFEQNRIDRAYLAEKTDAASLGDAGDGKRTVLEALRHSVDRAMDPATVGVPVDRFDALLARLFSDRPTAIFVGQGVSQQTHGTQSVRGIAILQMLLGNTGKRGGGVYALGAEGNERGAVENGLLHEPVGLAKAAGLIVVAENPAVCMPEWHEAADGLDWCVTIDQWESETSAWWRRPGVEPSTIKTEAFLLPMADALERDGSMTNCCGMQQQRTALVSPPGDCRRAAWFLDRIAERAGVVARPMAASVAPPPRGALRLCATEWREEMLPFPARSVCVPEDDRLPEGGESVPALGYVVRLGEHSQQGPMTRTMPWLVEMAPAPFVEIGKTLADRLGLRRGGAVRIRVAQQSIEMPAIVTHRLPPRQCGHAMIEQVAIVGQFGFCGLATGPTAVSLLAGIDGQFDPRSRTPAQKAFWCTIEKV